VLVPVGPTGELKTRVTRFETHYLKMISTQDQSKVEPAIEDMKKAGFGYGTRPMEVLHKHIVRGQIYNTNTAKALKICLKIYYLILPAECPKPPLHHRITIFFVLVSLLDIKLESVARINPAVRTLKPLPQKVMDLLPDILFHLKAKLVSDTAKCFGEDSVAARFEKTIFEDLLAKLGLFVPAVGIYVPLRESKVERGRFLKGVNELLKWADLPVQALEELLF
jgi:hypothetical protein